MPHRQGWYWVLFVHLENLENGGFLGYDVLQDRIVGLIGQNDVGKRLEAARIKHRNMIRNADSLIYTEVRPIWQEFRLTDDNLPAEINTIATTAPGMALWYRLILILPILFNEIYRLQPAADSTNIVSLTNSRCEREGRGRSVDCYY